MQNTKYWFGVARGPFLPSKDQKAPKIGEIGKMSLKMGNVRLYLVLTTKI
jgi:hypothetical protein